MTEWKWVSQIHEKYYLNFAICPTKVYEVNVFSGGTYLSSSILPTPQAWTHHLTN